VVSFFNTGHHAAFNKLGGDEVLIFTVVGNSGTAVRWGSTVVAALNKVYPPAHAREALVRSVYLEFDMTTGKLKELQGGATDASANNFRKTAKAGAG
jgi:hypothetical protein